VYRRGSRPGQVDHRGWISKVVEDVPQLEKALADGWQLTMQDAPAVRDVEAHPVPEPAPEYQQEPPLDCVKPRTRGRKARN